MPEEYEYPDAGKFAQPEVRQAVQRFRQLSFEQRAELPLLWWLLNDSTQAYKMTKLESEYVDHATTGTQRCENCDFAYLNVRFKTYICSQIQGEIKPQGWCRLWERGNHDPYKNT